MTKESIGNNKGISKRFSNLTAVFKPTRMCNLECTYCYVFDRSQTETMSDEVLQIATEQLIHVVRPRGRLRFLWHGGEPSLVGVKFYERALRYQALANGKIQIINSIQTNAYTITDELIDFLKEHHFTVGVSIDGPGYLHDRCRIDKCGKGTFGKVIRNVRRMKNAGLRLGAICVVTKQNKDHIANIYEFFLNEDISFQINPLINSGSARKTPGYHCITTEDYAEVVLELFDLWCKHEKVPLAVATIEDVIRSLLTQTHTGCSTSPNCQTSFLSIGPTGTIYPCGRFDGRKDFCYGNILQEPMMKILSSKLRAHLLKRRPLQFSKCRECQWINACNAGCMHNALEEFGDPMKPDYLCQVNQRVFPIIRQRVFQLLGKDTFDPNFHGTS